MKGLALIFVLLAFVSSMWAGGIPEVLRISAIPDENPSGLGGCVLAAGRRCDCLTRRWE